VWLLHFLLLAGCCLSLISFLLILSGRAQEQGSQRWYIPLLQRSSANFDKLNLPRIHPFHIFDVNHHNNSLSHYILQKPRLKVRISRPLHIFNFLHSSDQLVRDSSYQNCSIFQTLYRLPYGRLRALLPHAIHHMAEVQRWREISVQVCVQNRFDKATSERHDF